MAGVGGIETFVATCRPGKSICAHGPVSLTITISPTREAAGQKCRFVPRAGVGGSRKGSRREDCADADGDHDVVRTSVVVGGRKKVPKLIPTNDPSDGRPAACSVRYGIQPAPLPKIRTTTITSTIHNRLPNEFFGTKSLAFSSAIPHSRTLPLSTTGQTYPTRKRAAPAIHPNMRSPQAPS